MRGSPYEIHDEKFIRQGEVISYPNYDNTLHNGDVVLIRMNYVYIGLSYPISEKTPHDIFIDLYFRWNNFVVIWSNTIEYKPTGLKNVSSVAIQQKQVLHYSNDPERCPSQSSGQ